MRRVPKQARLDAPGMLHHLMIRGIEGREIVRDVRDRKGFEERMGAFAEESVRFSLAEPAETQGSS
jgi:putative transposase